MRNIVSSTCLGAEYFDIPENVLELSCGMWLSYLEMFDPSDFCFSASLGGIGQAFNLGLNFPTIKARPLLVA